MRSRPGRPGSSARCQRSWPTITSASLMRRRATRPRTIWRLPGRRKWPVVNPTPLPGAVYLDQCLDYDPAAGTVLWRARPVEHFSNIAHCNRWNTRYAGKPAGSIQNRGYHQIVIDDVKFLAHRIAWLMTYGAPVPQEIDHIDGNRANNGISNL